MKYIDENDFFVGVINLMIIVNLLLFYIVYTWNLLSLARNSINIKALLLFISKLNIACYYIDDKDNCVIFKEIISPHHFVLIIEINEKYLEF
jgi:hypothetical protein